jgi:hypothetical protein
MEQKQFLLLNVLNDIFWEFQKDKNVLKFRIIGRKFLFGNGVLAEIDPVRKTRHRCQLI